MFPISGAAALQMMPEDVSRNIICAAAKKEYEQKSLAAAHNAASRQKGLQGHAKRAVPARTTVMLANIPNNYSRDEILSLLDENGFFATYDFFYLPWDYTNEAGLGYAFINFISEGDVNRFYTTFHGFDRWALKSDKKACVKWSEQNQGYEANIARYRNSPVMHPDMPPERQPLAFKNGERITFPLPTKPVRAPHFKDCRKGQK